MADPKQQALLLETMQSADNIEANSFDGTAIQFDDFAIDDLVAVSKKGDIAYEEGEPIFSDALADALRQFITIADTSNTYNLAVGSDVRGGKVALPNAMGSLTQAHTTDDFVLWRNKHGLNDRTIFCATWKLDGMSGSGHTNEVGGLRIAYSRGNGFEGADITRHIKNIPSWPKSLPPNTEVRFEIIISKANFLLARERVFRRDGSKFKNARNMVSGLMNASTIDPIAYQYIDILVYHDWNENGIDKSKQLIAFAEMGFLTPEWETLVGGQLTDEYLTALLKRMKVESPYELDGIVIEADEAAVRMKMNPSKETLNPEHSRKYKVIDESNNAIATVKYVELRVSKRGYVKPRVHYEPFSLPGITCTHSTGYNMKFIIDNGISPGAKVHMYRAGDVIPNILRAVSPGSMTAQDMYDELDEIGEWKWSKNDKGEEVDVILTGDHANIGLKLAEAFFTGIEVDGLKLGNLQKMFSVGFDTPEKIIKMTAEDMGFALASQSTADKIYASLQKALVNMTLPQFMGATGLFGRGVGKRRVQQLYDAYGKDILTLEGFEGTKRIVALEKWDTKMAAKYINGLPAYLDFYESVKDYVQFVERVEVEGKLTGQVFAFTGFRNKELKAKLEAAGGEVLDSISSKVTTLIAADPEENSTKLSKARKNGTRIMGLGDVNDLF